MRGGTGGAATAGTGARPAARGYRQGGDSGYGDAPGRAGVSLPAAVQPPPGHQLQRHRDRDHLHRHQPHQNEELHRARPQR